MNKASTGFFARLRSRPAPETWDAADHGTAFGLDLSLQPLAHDTPPAAPPPGWQVPAWMQKLSVRGQRGA